MERGKLIVIEGTDCSGKETQSNLLKEKLEKDGMQVHKSAFPRYDTPTGHIIGSCILGKPHMGPCIFEEGTTHIPSKVASLYYAADRLYNINEINTMLDNGINVILDRYIESNMGHQAAKLSTDEEKIELMEWLEKLEFDLLELPKPDIVLFLYMPYQYAVELRNKRLELPDGAEQDVEHLKNAEKTYLLMAEKYNYNIVNCIENNRIRTIEEIHNDVYNVVKKTITTKNKDKILKPNDKPREI